MGVVYFSIIPTFEPSRYYKCWIVCFYYTNDFLLELKRYIEEVSKLELKYFKESNPPEWRVKD